MVLLALLRMGVTSHSAIHIEKKNPRIQLELIASLWFYCLLFAGYRLVLARLLILLSGHVEIATEK